MIDCNKTHLIQSKPMFFLEEPDIKINGHVETLNYKD